MPPAAMLNEKDYGDVSVPLLDMACAEIENMRARNKEGQPPYHQSFPPACLTLLRKIDGNHRCIDCGCRDPQWAAVSYGALLCLQCSGHHRSLGVHVSLVRSVGMDEWNLEQVVAMLEGGNDQLSNFFARHHLTSETCPEEDDQFRKTTLTKQTVTRLRYKTKAAVFYRQQLGLHVSQVLDAGPYRGRENSRTTRHYSTRQVERRNSE